MSKQITLANIANKMTESDVENMMQMEHEQTPEWSTLFSGMSYEQRNNYYQVKEQILKRKERPQKKSKTDIRNDYLAFYYQGVTRGSFSYTEEHFLEEVDSKLGIEKIKQHYGYDAFKLVKCLRDVRSDNESFTFFWETKSPFSQWHKSTFEGASSLFINDEQKKNLLGHDKDTLVFTSAEQFMMYHKAILFLDNEIASALLKETNASKIKKFGRQVRGFDEEVWAYFRSRVVYEGNKAKFSQNSDLMDALTNTMGTTLVEAAPNDKIWGIGLAEDNPRAQKRETWEGKNLLGEILTLLRMEFMGMY
jgi:ribA/ribD-fused uncharacterized protein